MGRHLDPPVGQRGQQGDITGGLVRAPVRGFVVGRTYRDEHGRHLLVAEVQLDLLERALDQERREGVHDRSHARQGKARSDVDGKLLPDPYIDDTFRVLDRGLLEIAH